MINNRQAGRRRGRGGGGNNGQRQGGGPQGNGSRIDSRSRGNATQLYEKYKNMAADAQRSGDRVTTEYYLQFADHYFRVLSEQRGRFEDQQPRRQGADFDFEGDEEYGDEGESIRGNEQVEAGTRTEMRDERPRDDRPRGDREYRRDANGNGDGRRDANGNVDTRSNGEGRSRDAAGEGRGRDRGEWQDRPRERRPEPVAAAPAEVGGQHRADPILPGESLEARAAEVIAADRSLDPPPARRRGRPRREEAAATAPARFEEAGFEADRLPPSLTLAANDETPAEPKPRRRRARPAEETPNAAE